MTFEPQAGILIALYYLAAGATLAGAINAALAARTDSSNLRYLWLLAIGNVATAGYQISTALYLTAPTIAASLDHMNRGSTFIGIWLMMVPAYVGLYTRCERLWPVLYVTTTFFVVAMLVNAFSPNGERLAGEITFRVIEFPWGERLHVPSGEPTLLNYLTRAVVAVVYAWCIWRGVAFVQEGRRWLGLGIIAIFIVATVPLVLGGLSDMGIIALPDLGGFVDLVTLLFLGIMSTRDTAAMRQQLQTELEEHRRTQASLEHLIYHDALTDLANRAYLVDYLGKTVAAAERNGSPVALVTVNLDRFDVINGALGHAAGDVLLCECARRLAKCARESDFVARLSGDEFAVVAANPDIGLTIGHLAGKIHQALSRPYAHGENELSISASLGIAVSPDDGKSASSLMTAADLALREAKRRGRNQIQYFRVEMGEASHERLRIGNMLRQAIDDDQFELHYQPKVRASDSRPVGAEALIRWRHPTEGNISPKRFIGVAEETHLIVPIGEWIVQQACRTLARWRDCGLGELTLAINLSARQMIRPDFASSIERILGDHAVNPARLEIEITESTLMCEPEQCIIRLGRLRKLGIKVAIDDFGTGYSSLSYLKMLPINVLKIDQSFVAGVAANADDRTICETTLMMARALGLATVAEGVETIEQARALHAFGCDVLQGYLFGRPMELEACIEYFRQQLTTSPPASA